MKSVLQILKSKPNQDVLSIAPDATVFDAMKLMAEKNIGALLVMEADDVRGIMSERDYARKVILAGRSSKEMKVSEIMSAPVRCVPPETKNEECMAIMTEHRLRHLPVMDGDELIGVVSIGDLVKDIISEQQFLIEQLEQYVTGQHSTY
ncbi:MAG: CBS domain-containing protein [Burkholderiales bacterium]